MSADPVIYCLENLTDYNQFERLCSDIAYAHGYAGLEPLGGTSDKGRDALHVDRTSGVTTVLAYSVREDWRRKLDQDLARIRDEGHLCQRITFFTTSYVSAAERDTALAQTREHHGWDLEIFAMERLRVALRAHPQILAHHPAIFCAPFFPFAGGLSLEQARDHILIDHVDEDAALAQWLSRRLRLSGFRVWCRGLAPLAGASLNDTVRGLTERRAFRYIAILSPNALTDTELTMRRAVAHMAGSQQQRTLVIPAIARQINHSQLDMASRALTPARFDVSWASGLRELEAVLLSDRCPRDSVPNADVVLRSYEPDAIVLPESEVLLSNLFQIRSLPKVIHQFAARIPLPATAGTPYSGWAFRAVNDRDLLSFDFPSHDIMKRFGITKQGGTLWSPGNLVEGIRSEDLVKELIRKSMYAHAESRGLKRSPDERYLYFPENLVKNDRVYFTTHDGTRTHFEACGERSHGQGPRATRFKHHLSPTFVPRLDGADRRDVIVRIRVYLTMLDGTPIAGDAVNARRKTLCSNWWNQHWLARIMGVMQFMGNGTPTISIGNCAGNELEVDCFPRGFRTEVRLNEAALGEHVPDEHLAYLSEDESEGNADE